MNEYVIGKYIRLSLEDSHNDSLSVENQRLILDKHISGMGIQNAKVMEFVDNGHSGMSFERPAVQELLELVRRGEVNCILVKDISRFGRTMIDTGYYIERVFPLYRVRFISVSDYFDSAEHEGDTGGTEVALKFLMHEYYSKDLSRKIRSAKRAKALRGEFVSKNCVFGYKKVVNRMEIDEPAAETIRLIFDLAASGLSIINIASRLYNEKRLTPAEHKTFMQKSSANEFNCVWNYTTIRKILFDEQYIGTFIAGRNRSVEVGSGRGVKVDESEWIKIPDHHPAIVDKAVFDAAQIQVTQRAQSREPLCKRVIGTNERYAHTNSPLKGRVVCGCCKHVMRQNNTKDAKFKCLFARAAPDVECHMHGIYASELESHVLRSIQEKVDITFGEIGEASLLSGLQNNQSELLVQAQKAKLTLYERFVLGEITADEYKSVKAGLDATATRAKQVQVAYKKDATRQASFDEFKKIAGDTLNSGELTAQLVDSLIDKVYVFTDHRIEIVWKSSLFSITDVDA